MRKTDKKHMILDERNNYRLYTGYRNKKKGKKKKGSENRWEEDGRGKGEMLILEDGEFTRQWEQHMQRLRGGNEAGRLTNKKEDSVVGIREKEGD